MNNLSEIPDRFQDIWTDPSKQGPLELCRQWLYIVFFLLWKNFTSWFLQVPATVKGTEEYQTDYYFSHKTNHSIHPIEYSILFLLFTQPLLPVSGVGGWLEFLDGKKNDICTCSEVLFFIIELPCSRNVPWCCKFFLHKALMSILSDLGVLFFCSPTLMHTVCAAANKSIGM